MINLPRFFDPPPKKNLFKISSYYSKETWFYVRGNRCSIGCALQLIFNILRNNIACYYLIFLFNDLFEPTAYYILHFSGCLPTHTLIHHRFPQPTAILYSFILEYDMHAVPGGSCFSRLSCSLRRRRVVRPRNTPKGSSIIVLPERSSSSRRTRPRNSPSGRCSRALEARCSTTRRGVPRNRVPASCLITLEERSLRNRENTVTNNGRQEETRDVNKCR